jgi:hypothetical protein
MLLDGHVYIQGGTARGPPRDPEPGWLVPALTGVDTGRSPATVPAQLHRAGWADLSDMNISGKMYYVNPAGDGSITLSTKFSGPTGADSSNAMFRPGKILQVGGKTNGAVIIDINGASPKVTSTQSLSAQRHYVNATILPDGKVLANRR